MDSDNAIMASQKTSHHAVFKKKTRSEFFQTQQLNASQSQQEGTEPAFHILEHLRATIEVTQGYG